MISKGKEEASRFEVKELKPSRSMFKNEYIGYLMN